MTARKGITEAQLKAALRKHAGVYAYAARDLGCDRANVKMRVDRSELLQQFLRDLEEEVVDAAEAVVLGQIIKGDQKMARWYLQTKGKHRGYSTRQEHTGAEGAPLPAPTVNVTIGYVEPKK